MYVYIYIYVYVFLENECKRLPSNWVMNIYIYIYTSTYLRKYISKYVLFVEVWQQLKWHLHIWWRVFKYVTWLAFMNGSYLICVFILSFEVWQQLKLFNAFTHASLCRHTHTHTYSNDIRTRIAIQQFQLLQYLEGKNIYTYKITTIHESELRHIFEYSSPYM